MVIHTTDPGQPGKQGGIIVKVAILGAGRIAAVAARTLSALPEFERWAIAARELSRAQAFAREHGFQRAYGSYEEMLRDPEVELVYIATPHSHHFEHIMLCLKAGVPAGDKWLCDVKKYEADVLSAR